MKNLKEACMGVVIGILLFILFAVWLTTNTAHAKDKPIEISNNCLVAMSANATSRIADKVCLDNFNAKVTLSKNAVVKYCTNLRKDVVADQIQVMVDRTTQRIALKGAIPFCNSLKTTEYK